MKNFFWVAEAQEVSAPEQVKGFPRHHFSANPARKPSKKPLEIQKDRPTAAQNSPRPEATASPFRTGCRDGKRVAA
jgi:hypothetical protein